MTGKNAREYLHALPFVDVLKGVKLGIAFRANEPARIDELDRCNKYVMNPYCRVLWVTGLTSLTA